MPTTIQTYRQWAQGNLGNEVALDRSQHDIQLEQASNRISALARFFGTSSAKASRKDAMADFTRVLSTKYGTRLANTALSSMGLSQTSKLTGRTIRAVIARAESLRDNAQLNIAVNLKLVNNRTVSETLRDLTGRHDEFQCMQRYMKYRAIAVELMGEMPLDEASLADFSARVDYIVAKLNALPGRPGFDRLDPAVRDDRDALVRALVDKGVQSRNLMDNAPRSETNVRRFKGVWRQAAVNALTALSAQATNPAMRNRLGEMLRDLADPVRARAFEDKIPLNDQVGKSVAGMLKAEIEDGLGKRDREFDEDRLSLAISAGYRQALNQADWPVIDKRFNAAIGGRPVRLRSVIVPGEKIAVPQGGDKGPIGERYGDQAHGFMCHSADVPHAVNLAVSSLAVEDDAGQPQLAFRGIRHGVHCAWEIKDPTARTRANVNRAKEAVIAAYLAAHPNPPDGPISTIVKIASVSLLTPDTYRHVRHYGGADDERRMLREQNAAWETIRGGVTFTHGGQTVTIRPQILKFNFGVNFGALRLSRVVGFGGGWDVSRPMNKEAFPELQAAARGFVGTPSTDPAVQHRQKYAKILLAQLEDILDKGEERADHNDAYKAAARVAVLTHLMGWTPCWNCKSGKDRTGQLDVECKFLSTLIAKDLPIPSPGMRLTWEQQGLFRAIAFEGGNFEVQQMNTGFGGYKTSGIPSIAARLGGLEYRTFHKGGSDFVGV
ncbi:MAG: hypothetical protein IK066_09560 [Kiritimatiellae bacterium]|nr:hypothetical protein [Kiritimatiellia bacterium]